MTRRRDQQNRASAVSQAGAPMSAVGLANAVVRVGPRAGWSLIVEVATWDVWVLRAVHPAGSFVVCLADSEVQEWLQAYDIGCLDVELDHCARRPPRRKLTRAPREVRRTINNRARSVGVEHEFEVWQGDRLAPFGELIGGLQLGGLRADPADPNARRSDLGVITVDGVEAEVATPPIPIKHGCPTEAVAAAGRIAASLESTIGDAGRLIGVSTHVSVTWPSRRAVTRSRDWALVFAPVVMLFMDRQTSPGLLVRPRPGRLELCGEHVVGDRLRATIALAIGSIIALESDPQACRRLAVRQCLVPAVARFGWYVDRAATGNDLYEFGRACPLLRSDTPPVNAGEHLRDVVGLLAPIVARTCGADDARLLADFADGRLALGCELKAPSCSQERAE